MRAQVALERRKQDSAGVFLEGMPCACWGRPGHDAYCQFGAVSKLEMEIPSDIRPAMISRCIMKAEACRPWYVHVKSSASPDGVVHQ